MESTGLNKYSKIAMLILASASVCSALIVLVTRVQAALLPYQIDYEEGNILNAAVRIVHGMGIYPQPHSWPNVINPYGPVGYEMVSWLVRLGGVQLALPRLMMIGWAVVSCILIGVIVWREVKSAESAVAFGALLLCFSIVSGWMANLRVDMLALALSLGGIAMLMVRRRWWWLSALLFVAAVFTKHTSLAAPAACVVWLWLEGERKIAAKLVGLCVAVGLCGLAYMQWRTHGTFLFYMTGTHADLFRWGVYFEQLYLHFTSYMVMTVFSLVAVVIAVARKKASLPVLYFLVAILTTVTIGKAGSNYNHLIELSASMCVAAAVGWSELSRSADARQRVPACALVVLLAATVVNNAVRLDFAERDSECEMAYTYLKNFPGQRVITENMAAAALTGKTLWISNPYVYTQLVKYGGWSDADLQEQLRKHQIDLVLFGKDQEWSPEMLSALEESYQVQRTFNCRTMPMAYLPKATSNGVAGR